MAAAAGMLAGIAHTRRGGASSPGRRPRYASGVMSKPAFLFRLFQLFDNRLKRAPRDVFLALEIR